MSHEGIQGSYFLPGPKTTHGRKGLLMTAILKIVEMLRLIDSTTTYIAWFTIGWILVPMFFAVIKKTENKVVSKILMFFPMVHFIVFYIINYTKGDMMKGIGRYGIYFVVTLIYCLGAITLARGKKIVRTLIANGVLSVLLVCVSIAIILIDGMSFHFANLSRMSYSDSMAALIDEVEENYILRGYKGVDFDELRAVYIPMAEEAEKNNDEVAFANAVANFCYEFHDGHFYIRITGEDIKDDALNCIAGNDYGFSMLRLDSGEVIAILTEEGSEASAKGIHNGTVITAWDGVEINEAIGNVRCISSGGAIRAYPIASNEEVAKPIFLAGQGGDTVNVTFIDDNGKEQTITVSCIGGYFDRLNEATWPLTHKRCEEFGYATMLDDHCGYICIPRESYDAVLDCSASLNDDYPEVRELLISRIEGLKAQGMERLIIDLRDNDGGLDCINEEVAALFADRETKIYAGFYDDASGKFVKSKYWEWKVNHDGRYSDIPVVVLVNAGCASSGDVLAHHLSQYPNVTIMGFTTTWGSGQAMGGECLMSGGHIAVRYPVIATLDSDCNVLIDAGADRVTSIPLDVKIPLDYAAVTAMYERGEDYELAYAVDYLNVNGVAS